MSPAVNTGENRKALLCGAFHSKCLFIMDAGFSDFWDDLLAFMEEGRVIPLIGRDLQVLPGEKGPTTLYRLLAQKLAEELKISTDTLPPDYSLSHVICAYPQFREKRQAIYPRVKRLYDSLAPQLAVPEPLRQLARISAFNLFVTTTFDPLMERALNEERLQRKRANVIAYSPNSLHDLPPTLDPQQAIVFQLMGRVSPSPDYAVTDGDILEFVHTLQSTNLRPQRLFDELRQSHLLILGTGFPDWLARFFLRLAKSEKLWAQRDRLEILAETGTSPDQGLVFFLNKFSSETVVFEGGNCTDFVAELHERWLKTHPTSTTQSITQLPAKSHETSQFYSYGGPPAAELDNMVPGSIFISYASEDRPAALKLHATLKEAGLDVWLDQDKLQVGDDYEQKIRMKIRRCSAFLPIISLNTENRRQGWFRREWFWAVQRLPDFAGTNREFLVPVVIDKGIDPDAAEVLEEFKQRHWGAAYNGEVPPELVEKLRSIIRSFRKREKVAA